MTRSEIISQLASKHEGLTILTFSVLHVNDIATNMYKEVYSKISKIPLFRLNAKKHLKLAEEARKKYEKGINEIVPERNSEFFANSNDRMDEEIAHYESVLYYQIKQRLDDFSIEYSDVLAKLIECKILTDFAVEVNNQAVSLIEKKIGAVKTDYLRLSKLKLHLREATDSLTRTDLDTENIHKALDNLCKVITSERVINKTIEE